MQAKVCAKGGKKLKREKEAGKGWFYKNATCLSV
jgi:hypothetical protein